MGSCSSVHRNSFCSQTVDKLVIPPSPIKENPKTGNFLVEDIALKSFNGSKEESFFDSKAWLDSDCEDDFYSVNGEFTPSRGTTPVHHTFGTPAAVNKTPPEHIIPGSAVVPPEPSPTEKRKKLLELFRESVRENQTDSSGDAGNTFSNNNEQKEEAKPIIHDLLLTKSAQSTPYYISGGNSAYSSSERSMNSEHVPIREKSVKSVQCCLPSLASCRSFSERRRKTSSPAIAANGKA